jgi:hypothetical protein
MYLLEVDTARLQRIGHTATRLMRSCSLASAEASLFLRISLKVIMTPIVGWWITPYKTG